MKTTWWPVLLAFIAGCGGDPQPSGSAAATSTATARPTATAVATATATATATAAASAAPKLTAPPLTTGDPLAGGTCPKQTTALTSWLKKLQAEGPLVRADPSITLVEANQVAGALQPGPRITVGATQILIDGALVASSKDPGFDAKGVTEALQKKIETARQMPGASGVVYVLVEADRGAPWHALVAATTAASEAGAAFATFLFAAPTQVSAPPASSYHTDFHAKFGAGPDSPAPILQPADPSKPGALEAIYKDCPDALKVKHAPSEALAKELPKAIAACSCKVDMAAVQALMWLAYDRYSGSPRTGLTINLAKPDGAGAFEAEAAPTAPWSDTSAVVREAAGKGKPVRLKAK